MVVLDFQKTLSCPTVSGEVLPHKDMRNGYDVLSLVNLSLSALLISSGGSYFFDPYHSLAHRQFHFLTILMAMSSEVAIIIREHGRPSKRNP
jgi:hypothetical protein